MHLLYLCLFYIKLISNAHIKIKLAARFLLFPMQIDQLILADQLILQIQCNLVEFIWRIRKKSNLAGINFDGKPNNEFVW